MTSVEGPALPGEEQVLRYFAELSNWGRWGPDDELGTLNLITTEKRRDAARLVRTGEAVGCARPIVREEGARDVTHPVEHRMLATGEEPGSLSAADHFGIAAHGLTVTHVDALSHQFWDGRMYNGRPSSLVGAGGAAAGAIDALAGGIVTRGVLLDIADLRGRAYLEPGDAIVSADLEAAERRHGVRVGSGDALLIRTGWYERRVSLGPPLPPDSPGLHAQTLPWLRARDVAVLGSDSAHDLVPSGYALRRPIHKVGMVAMGLCLVDNCQFADLARVSRGLGRWEFLFIVAPLRWRRGTVSPATPLAVF